MDAATNSDTPTEPDSVASDPNSGPYGDSQLTDVLRDRFGMSAFRPGQQAVIERLLKGKSAAAIFPTGGGKSLCYQLPAVMLEGLTIVVSPLVALMREQVLQLQGRGIAAERLDSSLTAEESKRVTQSLRSGETQILFVAPERFFNERFRNLLADLPIALFAVDEAHCISQWGHNFRPDYLKLARVAEQMGVTRILALTATATPTVLHDICQQFAIAPHDAVQTPFYRDNLNLQVISVPKSERLSLLAERLKEVKGTALVYVTLQQTAEQVAEYLNEEQLEARAYHAGMESDERRDVQDWFMREDDAIVVATIAFGMGIDKPDIRTIFHYNVSKSVENFAQEIGRAGRDGLPSVCESFVVSDDRVTLENFAYGNTPSKNAIRTLVLNLVSQPTEFYLSYYSLAHECDIRETVVRTLLARLELAEVLVAKGSRYEKYKFKPRINSTEILNRLSGEPRQFASAVLSMVVKKRVWCEVSLVAATDRLRCDRARIVSMLDYFAEQGWIELQASGLVHGYERKPELNQVEQWCDTLYDDALQREVGEVGRVQELYELLSTQDCISATLSAHFGQPLSGPCGHCSACNGKSVALPDLDTSLQLGDSATRGVRELAQEQPEALGEIRQQARFLCGLSSPRSVRKRLTRHPLYGCCGHLSLEHVMQELTESLDI